MTVIAYQLDDLVFCPVCAYEATMDAFAISGVGREVADNMDQAIVVMALAYALRNEPYDGPVAVYSTDRDECEACERALIPAGDAA